MIRLTLPVQDMTQSHVGRVLSIHLSAFSGVIGCLQEGDVNARDKIQRQGC